MGTYLGSCWKKLQNWPTSRNIDVKRYDKKSKRDKGCHSHFSKEKAASHNQNMAVDKDLFPFGFFLKGQFLSGLWQNTRKLALKGLSLHTES